jgi:serine/threonine protein phosphatase PrpC
MTHDVFVLSDVGRVRQHNEDDCLVLPAEQVYVVADGMGGHACGEVASRISVESIADFYADPEHEDALRAKYKGLKEASERAEKTEDDEEPDAALSSFHQYRLRTAVEFGNRQIFKAASRDARFNDMGTTVVSIAFSGSRVYCAYVGDSRVYRMRGDTLDQLTEDHSLANEFIRLGVLKPEDLPSFPYKNVIVRALGLQEEVEVDSFYRTAKPGDRFLLCSDGLTDLVSDDEMAAILADVKGAKSAAEALVSDALELGGVDNVTVMIVDVHE